MRDSILYMFWSRGSGRHYLNRTEPDEGLFTAHDNRERCPIYTFDQPLPDYSMFAKKLRRSENMISDMTEIL